MARPPIPAAAPASEEMAGVPVAANVDVMDEGGETGWTPFATIMQNAAGEFMVVQGLLPEGDEVTDDTGPTFPDGPALLKGIMELVNPSEDAEAAFGSAFRGEPDEMPAKAPPMPMA